MSSPRLLLLLVSLAGLFHVSVLISSSLLDSLAAQPGWTEWSIQVDSWSAGHGEIFWVIGESFLTFLALFAHLSLYIMQLPTGNTGLTP